MYCYWVRDSYGDGANEDDVHGNGGSDGHGYSHGEGGVMVKTMVMAAWSCHLYSHRHGDYSSDGHGGVVAVLSMVTVKVVVVVLAVVGGNGCRDWLLWWC